MRWGLCQRDATLIQITLTGFLSFFWGKGSLVLGIQFMPYHGFQLLLQAMTDFILIIVIHHQMVLKQSQK